MISQIPSSKNWPEDPRRARLKIMRSKIVPIEVKEDRSALRNLVRVARKFQKGQPGKIEQFIAAYWYRDEEGIPRLMMDAWGKSSQAQRSMIAQRLKNWVDGAGE